MAAYLDPVALARGQAINRRNRITALLCGGVPAALLAWQHPPGPAQWLAGLALGLLWANAFEYALHRWLLHWPGTYAAAGHALHHDSIGRPDEPLYVNLGGRPLWVVLMFAFNGGPLIAADLWLAWRVVPGMLLSFALYFMLTEEIHWRFHVGGWLPHWLERARRRHLRHHARAAGDFAIFLPLWDRLLGGAAGHRGR